MVKILRFALKGLLVCVGALGKLTVGIAVSIHPTFAQLTSDNTLGIERSVVIPIDKDNDAIGGGAARGTNLFHSFQDFNVGVGRGVYFANPQGITNIFSRVTGGNSSNIFGTLGVSGNANLFLLNPNGIVFGKNASLDVQGSFLGTTANSLVFPNGVEFSATNPQAPPLLTINVPIGLQFGSQPGSITSQAVIRNSQGNAVGSLSVGTGSTLALMGGEITLDGSILFTENGQVKLGAVSGDTTLGLNVNGSSLGFKLRENFGRASINLTNGRIFAVGGNSAIELFGGKIALNSSILFGNNGGSIVVDATHLNLDNDSKIHSATFGVAKGGDIQIQASDAVTLANSSSIFSGSNGDATGTGGNVSINAGKITITEDGTPKNSGGIGTLTVSKGNGGNLTFNATESVNVNGGYISVTSGGAGNAGNLTVQATDAVNITNQGYLGIYSHSSGSTGNLRIETGTLRVQNTFPGGGVAALASGSGSVGSISIQARNAVEVTQGDIFTGVFLPLGGTTPAIAEDITIETQQLNLKDGSHITTSTDSNANAANIFIKASEYVSISGTSYVSSGTFSGSGNGGNVTIETPRLSLTQGGFINTPSFTSSGNAGNITIRAKDVELDGFVIVPNKQLTTLNNSGAVPPLRGTPYTSNLSSEVNGSNADAKGGTITIDTERLRLSNGGNVSTSVFRGQGQGGNLVVRATDSIDISGVGAELLNGSFAPSGLFADVQTGGIGSGGRIDVTTGRLNLSNNGQISASTFNQGNAGNITINAEQIDLRRSSAIRTQVNPEAKGNAGNISIKTQLLNVQEKSQISSGTFGNGNAGNITINSGDFSLQDGAALFNSTLGQGNAGNILVQAEDNISANDSVILSNIGTPQGQPALGNVGNIELSARTVSLTNGAQLQAGFYSGGQGNAGLVSVKAQESISFTGENSGIFTDVESGAVGNGSNIQISAPSISLTNGAVVTTSNAGQGNAGNILVQAEDNISANDSLILSNIGSRQGQQALGNVGNIELSARTVSLTNGAQLQAGFYFGGQGNAGLVSVKAQESISFTGKNSGIFTNVESGAVGNGSDIQISAPSVSFTNGAVVNTSNAGQGNAGNILVQAQDNIFANNSLILSNIGTPQGQQALGNVGNTEISARTVFFGRGGDIKIQAANVFVTDDVTISSSSLGEGIAGDVNIKADTLRLNKSQIRAQAASTNGGNININSDLLLLRNSAQISTTAGTAQAGGNGGNININSKFIVAIPEENSDISANAYTGTGGQVQINSQGIFGIKSRPKPTGKSDITASSELGVSGITNINAPDTTSIQNSFTEFSPNVINTNALIANSCISRSPKQKGTFFITGSGALRNSPGDGLISIYSTGEVRSVNDSTSHSWKKGDLIIEPTAAYRLADGSLVLSRECQPLPYGTLRERGS